MATEFSSVLKEKSLFPVCRLLVRCVFTGVVKSSTGADTGVALVLLVPGAQLCF